MISPKVMNELHQAKLVPTQFTVPKPGENAWSPAEQRRFWKAIKRFPQGPWTAIAACVGSKSTRQAMTHAQKLRQKLSRWKRRVRSDSINSLSSISSASTTTNDKRITCSNESQSPTKSILNQPEERDTNLADDGSSVDRKEFNELQYFVDQEQVHDTHDDRYLEHLLSEIEPVLEHVAYFTNNTMGAKEASRLLTAKGYGSEQALYIKHRADIEESEHESLEHTWSQSIPTTAYQQRSSQASSTSFYYMSTQSGHNYICQL
ncbi:myb-like dna-binding [Plasmopara halstedii]|uniref:Myb-like dna-binding n=1 Tax=Plasmopara halstedii TaxID=4781 RepID=A0A0P1AW62_PLAHL|nr:myb-like dna-binding [Plasmopara halstedii]CEG46468.1 myb-like dna-binding [Plasmopara halstedii]|eukprot:XP_024582837.1 myb-like dna-binding [Plasmopara halstedii]